jgi:hypothetical protein
LAQTRHDLASTQSQLTQARTSALAQLAQAETAPLTLARALYGRIRRLLGAIRGN